MSRHRSEAGIARWLVITIVAVLAVGAAAFAGYWFVIKTDPAPEAKIAKTKVTPDADTQSVDGSWVVRPNDSEGSFVGYRVEEDLRAIRQTATARTTDVSGSMDISGTEVSNIEVVANLASLESDSSQRDDQVRSGGLQTDQFPEGKFVSTQPVTLPAAPTAGQTITVNAVGDLTLHGVTKQVTFPLEGRWDGTTVQVVGRQTIQFADFDIEPFSRGFVETDDKGVVEMQLFFVKG